MNRSFRELNKKDFKISDIDYAKLNLKLSDSRLNYKKGKSSYDFMRYYENYLYQRKEFAQYTNRILLRSYLSKRKQECQQQQ